MAKLKHVFPNSTVIKPTVKTGSVKKYNEIHEWLRKLGYIRSVLQQNIYIGTL